MLSLYRILIRLLKESDDPIVLAVASHDIGQYVKHYDRGKKYVLLLSMRCHLASYPAVSTGLLPTLTRRHA